jgi:capsular exopolysaccharide synthesis family protein
MSRIFEALQQYKTELNGSPAADQVLPDFLTEAPAQVETVQPDESIPLVFGPQQRLVALSEPDGLGAEKLRVLATRLRQRKRVVPQLTRLLITSSIRGEGKSVMSANLASTLALQQQRTLLIDGDLRCPSLCAILGTQPLPGLSEWSQEERRIDSFIRRAGDLPLWFLPAGEPSGQPGSVLETVKMAQMMTEIAGHYDWVIVDSPPLPPFADSRQWATMVDAVLLVVREGITPKSLLQSCFESIDPKKLLGTILNDAATVANNYYRGYYNAK